MGWLKMAALLYAGWYIGSNGLLTPAGLSQAESNVVGLLRSTGTTAAPGTAPGTATVLNTSASVVPPTGTATGVAIPSGAGS